MQNRLNQGKARVPQSNIGTLYGSGGQLYKQQEEADMASCRVHTGTSTLLQLHRGMSTDSVQYEAETYRLYWCKTPPLPDQLQ